MLQRVLTAKKKINKLLTRKQRRSCEYNEENIKKIIENKEQKTKRKMGKKSGKVVNLTNMWIIVLV